MESREGDEQYSALKTIMKLNGLCLEFFAVEFGAKGCCSSLFYAVKKLDFNNTLTRKADEKLRYVL